MPKHAAPGTVCVDWNGVLDTYQGWQGPDFTYPPREGVGEFLYALMQRGYHVIIYSSRKADLIWHWLRENDLDGFVSDVVSDCKPPAIAYIDDRGIRFEGDFGDVLIELDTFAREELPHWMHNT